MRTAEEILTEHLFKGREILFTHNEFNICIEAMKSYAKEACEKQREICAKQFIASADVTCRQSAAQEYCRTAPEPPLV